MLKKILLFLFLNISVFSVFYTVVNFNVIAGDLSLALEGEGDSTKQETASSSDAVFFLERNPENKELNTLYENFPWKWELEGFVNFMDERKSTPWLVIKIDENKQEEKKKDAGLIIKEDTKAKKTDILDLSLPMTEEEIEKYGDTPHIVIEKLKVTAPILFPNVEEYDLEGVILKMLEQGVVHRPETQLPEQNWNFFLIGHSSNLPWIKSKYNNIFAWLPRLNEGDKVKIYYKGRKFVYEMYTKFVVPPTAVDVYGYIPWHNLTIMTCYPIWTDKDRMIGRFRLTTQE